MNLFPHPPAVRARETAETVDDLPLDSRERPPRWAFCASALVALPQAPLDTPDDEPEKLVARKEKNVGVLVDALERHPHVTELDVRNRHDALVSQSSPQIVLGEPELPAPSLDERSDLLTKGQLLGLTPAALLSSHDSARRGHPALTFLLSFRILRSPSPPSGRPHVLRSPQQDFLSTSRAEHRLIHERADRIVTKPYIPGHLRSPRSSGPSATQCPRPRSRNPSRKAPPGGARRLTERKR